MAEFAVDRNCIFGMHQRIDQLDLFLAGMTGYMHILEDHLCSLHGQLIDNLGNCFFISRNRIGTQDHGISRFHLYIFRCIFAAIRDRAAMDSPWLPVVISTSLFIRIIFHLLNINERIFRNIQISQLCRCA